MEYRIPIKDIIVNTIGILISNSIVWGVGYLFSKVTSPIDFLTTSIPLWFLLTLLSFEILIYFIHKLLTTRPPFLKEHEMRVNNLSCSWIWKHDEEVKRYCICDLEFYCPQCGSILSLEQYEREYHCVNGHSISLEDIKYTETLNYIVDLLRKQYPKYRDMISSK